MADDPAIVAVAAYWDAIDALAEAKRVSRRAWFAASDIRKSGRHDAMERAEAVEQDASRAYCDALRGRQQSMDALTTQFPASRRGAIELLTAALAEFSEPFDNLGSQMTFCPAEVPAIIRSVRDALELWETPVPPLLESEPE